MNLAWFLGFKLFVALKHPTFAPLRWLKTRLPGRALNTPPIDRRPAPLPKKIWIYWAQGWDNAPELVRLCRASWEARNPSWQLMSLDESSVAPHVPLGARLRVDIPRAAYSDIVRVELLAAYGGVWVDATTFCNIPLDSWLPSVMPSGFFAFEKPKTTLASWFIAAQEGHPLVVRWREYVRRYWCYAKAPGRYFWFHYLFEYLLVLDGDARRVWRDTPRVSSDGPYVLQRAIKAGKGEDVCRNILFKKVIPLHKLDWKWENPGFLSELLAEALR